VIVSIHGGGWHSGSKEASPGTHFTRYGYAVAAINYRLIKQGVFPAPIHDCKAAVRWLRANGSKYGLDTRRIGAWGASREGTWPRCSARPAVWRIWKERSATRATRAASRPWWITSGRRICRMASSADPAVNAILSESQMMGFDVVKYPDRAVRANPITYVSPDDPPFFIGHGMEDKLVPVSQSELLDAALSKAGVASEFHIVPGAGHSVPGLALDDKVRAFFDRCLKR
jgi:acetyl esterase/lipase